MITIAVLCKALEAVGTFLAFWLYNKPSKKRGQ